MDGIKEGLTKYVWKCHRKANSKVIKMQSIGSNITKSSAQILRKEGLLMNQGRRVLDA